MPKTEMARCYTPEFPYQRDVDGYVEMSEEDAALFWEVNIDTAIDHKSASIGSMLPDRAAPTDKEAAAMIPIRPVPNREPDDPQRTDASASPMDDSQDTKPVESTRTACRRDRTGALADDTYTPRPLYLQATISTQTDETNQIQT